MDGLSKERTSLPIVLKKEYFIKQFPELSVNEGLDRIQGDTRFYCEMLVEFRHISQNKLEEVECLFRQSKFEDSMFLLHTLKGILQNIGAKDMVQLALTLEVQLEDGYMDNSLFHDFKKQMEYLQNKIGIMERELQ